MGYKVILIENDVKMSIKLNNIIINKEGHEFTREEIYEAALQLLELAEILHSQRKFKIIKT